MSKKLGTFALAAAVCLATSGCTKPADAEHAKGGDAMAAEAKAEPASFAKPEYTADGALKLPADFEQWVYVGSPLTPNALNGGKANFPEFHNVYIQPGAYREYQRTGVFPEGTIMFKELQLTLKGDRADGSRAEASGRGYFPGALNGADVSVKDSKRFAETNGWGYFDFNHNEPKAATAQLQPKKMCADCHLAGAKKDMVWTQFYPRLDR